MDRGRTWGKLRASVVWCRRVIPSSFPIVVLALMAACSPDDRGNAPPQEADAIPSPSVEQSSPPDEMRECVDRREGFAVAYPATWYVNDGTVLEPCRVFHPEPFQIPVASELPIELAVSIDFEGVPIETILADSVGRRERWREETHVDGREAVRIEAETTGMGLLDAGITFCQYVVDLGDTTMLATTYDAGPVDFASKRRILDAMMASFDFRQPE